MDEALRRQHGGRAAGRDDQRQYKQHVRHQRFQRRAQPASFDAEQHQRRGRQSDDPHLSSGVLIEVPSPNWR